MNSKDHPWMDLIRNGTKTVEGRINSIAFSCLRKNHFVRFHNRKKGILCKVTFTRFYKDFEMMLENEGVKNLAPHVCTHGNEEDWKQAALKLYHSFPGAERVKQKGAIAIGLKFIRDYNE